jgi:hypothetical protein
MRFVAMSRKQAAHLWHKARAWDRETHQSGRHGGIIGRVALDVYYCLALDFQNFRTGRLDPSLDAIAAKACCCRRAVVDAIARLRNLGMISWQRRCEETRDEAGRFRLRQRTNAYAVLPLSQWRGYRDLDRPPPPDPATLGAPEPIPEPIEAAVAELTYGQRKASLATLEADPRDALALALAAFGRAIDERESGEITEVHRLPSNLTQSPNPTGEQTPTPPPDDLEAAKTHWLRVLLSADKGG